MSALKRKVNGLIKQLPCFVKSIVDGLLLHIYIYVISLVGRNAYVGTHRYIIFIINIQLHVSLKITCVTSTRPMDDPPEIPAFGSREKHSSQNLLKEMAKVLILKTQEPEQKAVLSKSGEFSPGKIVDPCSNYVLTANEGTLYTIFFDRGGIQREQKEPILSKLKKLSAI